VTFRLSILTPDERLFDAEADVVIVPGLKGMFGVLPGHAPMVAALGLGVLHVKGPETERWFVVSGGVAEIDRDHVAILAESVSAAGDAFDAEERAQELRAEVRTTAG
jgi:F-type H+-transporting ATPase subunit epsilon